MRQQYRVLLLVAALLLLSKCNCEEEAEELVRIKGALRDCRSDLNNLEVAKDRCSEAQRELNNKIKLLKSKVSDLDAHEYLLLGAKEETDLVRKELLIAQDRLAVCDINSKSHESREAICRQDLDLARAELTAAAAREAEAEKALRQNDCTAARRDLRTYRDMAEQSAIDAEALKKKIIELEAVASSVPEIESRLVEAKKATSKTESELAKSVAAKNAVKAEMEAKVGALQAELDATKKALESLLASLDTRQKYEALLEEHEKEWLPHWFQERMHALLATGHAVMTAVLTALEEIVNNISSIVSTFWELYVYPVFVKIDSVFVALPGWTEVRDTLGQSMHSIMSGARQVGRVIFNHVLRAEEASEGFVLSRMQRVDSLKSVARHDVVHYAFWGAFASLVLPISLAILKILIRNLINILRPGSATVSATAPHGARTVQEAVEELLGYRFSKANTLKSAFAATSGDGLAGEESGGSAAAAAAAAGRKRLAFLGTAVAQTLAAEKALISSSSSSVSSGQQEDSDVYAMQQMAARAVSSDALASAAAEIGVDTFVRPGPGARSNAVAQATQGELYAACLGAVYLDSDFDIKAARDVWNKKKGRKSVAAGGASLLSPEALRQNEAEKKDSNGAVSARLVDEITKEEKDS